MQLLDHLTSMGYKYKVVSITHLHDLKREIEEKYHSGILKEEVYSRYLASLSFSASEEIPNARSIIAIAVPRNLTKAVFTMENKKYDFTIPPTYWKYRQTVQEIKGVLSDILDKYGFHAAATDLSEKLLAVHSGLAFYGKNNITYIPGWGSFYQLVSYFSDMPAGQDEWHELRMLEKCNNCSACEKVCPTNAISAGRFTINAEKCLTFYNENEDGFPGWLNPKAHNSLIGCMYCQHYCPENKQFRNNVDVTTEFSETETRQIFDAGMLEELPLELNEKLENLCIVRNNVEFTNLKRNMRVLIANTDTCLEII